MMPHDPQNWLDIIKHMPPWLGGMLMAMVIAVLRVVYDKEETHFTRVLLEAFICGSLTLAFGSGADAMGMGDGWHLFIGGLVGFLGSQAIRRLAYRAINSRIGK